MRHSEAGFMMADALVAIMIAALFVTSVFSINATMLRTSESAKNRLEATLLAKGIIEQDKLTDQSGQTVIDGVSFDWQMRTRNIDLNQDRLTSRLVEVEVEIVWPGYRSERRVSVTARKLRSRYET